MTRTINCRACQYTPLKQIFSLGRTPLANSLLSQDELGQSEPTFPLDVSFCQSCSLVQITETVPPDRLFRHYAYFSSFSDTVLKHAEDIAGRLIKEKALDSNGLVVEIASNDGYLLKHYVAAGIPVLGIEPALNIAEVARQRGIDTLSEFFGDKLAAQLAGQGLRADIIHANNVLAHVPDLNGVARGIGLLLKDSGVAVIEVPYVQDLIDKLEFDTIYHEHLCYFSLSALDKLFKSHNLTVSDVERISLHGGSLRLFVSKSNQQSENVIQLLDQEKRCRVDQIDFYEGFWSRILALREELTNLLTRLKDQGASIVAYGASAKGSTLLNFFGIGSEFLDYVVDRSTVKQGLFTPGTHLPIHAPERLLADLPDYVLLLSWNHVSEILSQQAAYRQRGGRFIIPVPEPIILDPIAAGQECLQPQNQPIFKV